MKYGRSVRYLIAAVEQFEAAGMGGPSGAMLARTITRNRPNPRSESPAAARLRLAGVVVRRLRQRNILQLKRSPSRGQHYAPDLFGAVAQVAGNSQVFADRLRALQSPARPDSADLRPLPTTFRTFRSVMSNIHATTHSGEPSAAIRRIAASRCHCMNR